MYIPSFNRMTDSADILAFMQRYSFATLITAKDHLPVATHLPFVIRLEGEQLVRRSHVAKANKQWTDLDETTVMVIFSQPHAYISPQHYETQLNVPTWNYIAIHAYGRGRTIQDPDQIMELLESTITTYESGYKAQWDTLPAEYKHKMAQGIVAFEVDVTDLQAKHKLSQNRSPLEQENIIRALSQRSDTDEQEIAAYMQKNLEAQKKGSNVP